MLARLRSGISRLFANIRFSDCLISLAASAFLAFGLYNVHAVSQVTEGGVLGMTLLLEHWFSISPDVYKRQVEGQFGYALSGAISREELQRVSEEVYKQLQG